jgi:hypothetical protein
MENAHKVNNWRFKSGYEFDDIKNKYIAIVPLQDLHQEEASVTGNKVKNVNGLSYKEFVRYLKHICIKICVYLFEDVHLHCLATCTPPLHFKHLENYKKWNLFCLNLCNC